MVSQALSSELKRVGLPFLERFSAVAEVHRVIASAGDEARLVCPIRERWPEILNATTNILAGTA